MELEYIIAHLLLLKPDPFFIEIGANDGKWNDPLHPFIARFDWGGVLIEPMPQAFALLEQTYAGNPHVKLLRAAVAHEDGMQTIYSIREDGAAFNKAHQFSCFSRDAVLRQTEWHSRLYGAFTCSRAKPAIAA